MVVIKFAAEKLDKGQIVVLPSVLIDSSEKAAKAKILIGFAWLGRTFAIGIKWTKKAKIAAIGDKSEQI